MKETKGVFLVSTKETPLHRSLWTNFWGDVKKDYF